MSFQLGDTVRVTNPSSAYVQTFRDKFAEVTGIVPGHQFKYELTFASGYRLGFAEDEISAVEEGVVYKATPDVSAPAEDQEHDEINHPSHYTWLPNGLEVIDITENMNFNLGNVVKYVLRADHKHDESLTDLRKAAWYITREIQRLETE